MTALLFYGEPVFLDREQHKNLKYKASSDFSYTEKVNSVPLTGIEFFEVSRDMPVLFHKNAKGEFSPLALLSLMEGGHKQLGEKGRWLDSYIPAFVRRYPFAMTKEGSVCFDKSSPQLNEKEGELLFTEQGENSDALNDIINFLNNYDHQNKLTQAYCSACVEQSLFTPFSLKILPTDEKPLRLEGLYMVDEEVLNKLPDDKLAQWFRSGWLAWTYAHLHSLGAFYRLVKKQQDNASEK